MVVEKELNTLQLKKMHAIRKKHNILKKNIFISLTTLMLDIEQ